jgi:glycosyltransferase involved in cell wall biosynthesis
MPSQIHIVLPPREGFGPKHFGAVALCVRDFILHSRFADRCTVFGGVECDAYKGISYRAILLKRKLWRSKTQHYATQLIEIFRKEKPALIEIHNRPALANKIMRHWEDPVTLHLHNDPQTMVDAKSVKERQKLLKRCSAIYCVSDYIRQRFLEGLDDPEKKVRRIYNGIEIPETIPAKQNHILFVGRFQPEKGALELAQALQQILPDHPEWKAIFIGAARHDPKSKQNAYQQQVWQLLEPLSEQIEMRGFCSYEETFKATLDAAIAVIPSRWDEAFGRTALEAMACGCATVSSTRGGLSEVVGEGALRLADVTSEAIESALQNLLMNESERLAFQEKGHKQAEQFSIQKVTAELDDLRGIYSILA